MYPVLQPQGSQCQCNGFNYVGPKKCQAKNQCYAKNPYYSMCNNACPANWACQRMNKLFINFSSLNYFYLLDLYFFELKLLRLRFKKQTKLSVKLSN